MISQNRHPRVGAYACRNKFCPNRYDDTIGGDHAFGKKRSGAECIPCLYADQMVNQGLTIEKVEAVPHLMEMFVGLLSKTGWTWQDMKDSYERMRRAGLPAASQTRF